MYLKEDGFVVIQSYCGGVNTDIHKGYIDAVKDYMELHKTRLRAFYRWKEAPGCALYISSACNEEFSPGIIKDFHGRGVRERNHEIELLFCQK